MTRTAEVATVRTVNEDIGRGIQRRRTRLGMSVKALAERAGVDRSRVAALEAGNPSVRQTTAGAILAALDELEEEMGFDTHEPGSDGMVEFRVTGNFGVDVVVKGPVSDLAALELSVSRLVEKMGRNDSANGSQSVGGS